MRIRTLVSFLGLFLLFSATPALSAGWVAQSSGVTSSVTQLDGSGTALLMAITGTQTVLISQDGGAEWTSETVQSSVTGLDVASSSTAFITGTELCGMASCGFVTKSTDGGDTWSEVFSGSTVSSLYGIYMYSSSVGWVVGADGEIYKTTDGGSNWSAQTSGTSEILRDVDFVSSTIGFVVGDDGAVLKTTNGGSSWTTLTISTSEDLLAVDFVSSSIGWVGGENETFYKTTNGGTSWSAVGLSDLGATDTIYDIDADSTTRVLLSTSAGLLETTDGSSWDDVTALNTESVTATYYYATNARWLGTADGSIYRWDGLPPDAPTNLTTSGTTSPPSNDTVVTFSWTPVTDDESSIDHYEFKLDDGSWTDSGALPNTLLVVTDNGTHTFSVRAVDEADNEGSEASIEFAIDTAGPTVSTLSPTTATVNASTTFSVTATDVVGVEGCTLYVNGSAVGSMTASGSTYSRSHTFSSTGTQSGNYALCTDEAGNSTSGTSVTVTVSTAASTESTEETTSEETTMTDGQAQEGDLIKMACEAGALVNDPCTAVYYYAAQDGKRHAFTNEKVYFTWYDDFDDVKTVSRSFMASLSLGRNVTYHPGTKMVKFQTVNTVYAVSAGSVLRAIASEDLAEDLYGEDWNKQIDDISDAFYSNYDFGTDIDEVSDYDPVQEEDSVDTIDEDLDARS
ncbi:MAG: YCF48-related protein [Patescibacteria group bacterium]